MKRIAQFCIIFLALVGNAEAQVQPTPTWTDFSSNASLLSSMPIPVGARIQAYDPQGVLCGEFTVHTAGSYGYLHVYGDDPVTPADEGASAGDTIRFRILWQIYDAWGNPSVTPIWSSGTPGAILSVNVVFPIPVPDPPLPAVPTPNQTGVSVTPSFIWHPSSVVERYHLQVSSDESFIMLVVNDTAVTDTSIAKGEFLNNTQYYWRVRAWNISGYGEWSSVSSFTTERLSSILTSSKASINFHDTKLTNTDSLEIVLSNTSNRSLTVNLSTAHPDIYTFPETLIIPQKTNKAFWTYYTPKAFGPQSGEINISANNDLFTIPFTGTSPFPTAFFSVESISFENIAKDDTARALFTITNNSINALNIDSIFTRTPIFAVDRSKGTLATNETVRVELKFMPVMPGVFKDTIVFRSNAQVPTKIIPVEGSCPTPLLTSSLSRIDFPNTVRGQSSQAVLRLSDVSPTSLVVSRLSISTSQFSINQTAPLPIKGNSEQDLTVTFTPDRFGPSNDTLIIESDGGNIRIPLTGLSPYPQPMLSNERIDFGLVGRLDTNRQQLRIKNTSINSLVLDSMFTTTRWFTIDRLSGTLGANESLAVVISFSPDIVGTYTDTLIVANNSATPRIAIPLSGESPLAVLVLSHAQINFGDQKINQAVTRSITVRNISISPLTISTIALRAGAFTTTQTAPAVIKGKDSLTFTVQFFPTAFQSSRDTIFLKSDGGDASIPLSGISPYPMFIANTQSMEFGTCVKNTSTYRILRIANTSVNTLIVDSIVAHTAEFTTTPHAGTVAVGETLNVIVGFRPVDFGIFSDTLILTNNSAASPVLIPLSGICPAPFMILTTTAIDYGTIPLDETVTRPVTIHNKSINELIILELRFRIQHFHADIAAPAIVRANDSLLFSVVYNPTLPGLHHDTLFIVTNVGTREIVLDGVTPAPTISVTPTSIDFGTVKRNTVAKAVITVNNSSISNLKIVSLYTTIPNFGVQAPPPTIVVRKQDTLRLIVSFKPDSFLIAGTTAGVVSFGDYEDTLYVRNNSLTPLVKIPLKGKDVSTGIGVLTRLGIPSNYLLEQNYPNPFNPTTRIRFGVPVLSLVRIAIYNILGEVVTASTQDEREAGYHEVVWNAIGASGVYIYRIEALSKNNPNNRFIQTKRMMFLK